MNKNQALVITSCSVLCLGIYLFASTKKPADEKIAADSQHSNKQQREQQVEALNIDEYIAEVSSKIADKSAKDRIGKLVQVKAYKEVIQEYQKLDKPLAVAYYYVKLADRENKADAFAGAGDYNAMLMQTAPDDKAKNFLSANALQCYQKAVLLDSSKNEYKIRLAGAYIENGSAPMQGVSILLEIVRKDSNNVDAQLMLGRFGIISGQYDKAIARLEKVLYLQPQNSEAMLLLAEAYSSKGDKTKAIELLEKCKAMVTSPEGKKEIENYIQNIKKPNG